MPLTPVLTPTVRNATGRSGTALPEQQVAHAIGRFTLGVFADPRTNLYGRADLRMASDLHRSTRWNTHGRHEGNRTAPEVMVAKRAFKRSLR